MSIKCQDLKHDLLLIIITAIFIMMATGLVSPDALVEEEPVLVPE